MKLLRFLCARVRYALFGALLITPSIWAATFTVATTANIGAGSLHQAITDANNTTTYNYDGSGRLLSVTKRRGNARISQTYDANGRVATQTELATNTSSFTYASHKTTITDPRGKTRVHTYTEAGALSACTDEENKTIALSSGATGRRSSVTDRIGRMTTLTYHAPSGDRRTWSDHHDHA